jgi:hypothetical protein
MVATEVLVVVQEMVQLQPLLVVQELLDKVILEADKLNLVMLVAVVEAVEQHPQEQLVEAVDLEAQEMEDLVVMEQHHLFQDHQ